MQSRRPRLPGSLSTLEDESNVPGHFNCQRDAKLGARQVLGGEGKGFGRGLCYPKGAFKGRRLAPGPSEENMAALIDAIDVKRKDAFLRSKNTPFLCLEAEVSNANSKRRTRRWCGPEDAKTC